ncbi:hypothetical protein DMR_05950 [Solidesulfovibrio magneticus RS-1]|uniref:Uncharacterized protein n=1 Tax=Solidesulfovibrio magneticus (strain ATCC 700980 / DSM 13731 / RS-1) TaxID=573370 RepID=C4XIC4_SOLM1|nr:hypothetical protein DMR_05950 [Solidesulfovibrio magneticus RS-1]
MIFSYTMLSYVFQGRDASGGVRAGDGNAGHAAGFPETPSEADS